jgi:integrase
LSLWPHSRGLLALRWSDLDVAAKALRIERAIEMTEAHGLTLKPPKTKRGFREITIDDDLFALLMKERERHFRIAAGVPDGAEVDLSLVKLPPGALMFPNPTRLGKFSFTGLRNPNNITKEFARKAAAIGFPACGSTTFGALMKPCYWIRAWAFTSSLGAVGTIRL